MNPLLKYDPGVQQSHLKKISDNLYQPGGQDLWASPTLGRQREIENTIEQFHLG